jgi:hypothetical protein
MSRGVAESIVARTRHADSHGKYKRDGITLFLRSSAVAGAAIRVRTEC